MFYALNEENEKIHANYAQKGKSYRCPCCGQKMILKKGQIKEHHFAHIANICDPWYHENKGPWHKEMQNHFKADQCEVRVDGENGEYHIADVFLERKKNNVVIEFQNSPITKEEFDKRNRFYSRSQCKKWV